MGQSWSGSETDDTMKVFVIVAFLGACTADRLGHSQLARGGRQEDSGITGGVDFSGCVTDPDTGLCCVDKEETVTSLEKEPILECTHKNTEQCHYTYVTQFEPSMEEVCEENIEKVCNGQGPEECKTVYESSCTTKYVEKQPGKFVGDTGCEKLPIEICGAGCTYEEGPEECHDKVIASLVDVPEEVCDLNPQKTCRFITKLVPKLKPEHQCTIVPQEICNLKFTQPQQVDKPLLTKWCLDPTPAAPGESYDEENAAAPPIGPPEAGPESAPQPAYEEPEQPTYESVPLDTSYLSPG